MFERFTDRARAVVVHAQDEARELNHNYIGTEHLLLGLLGQEGALAARALRSLGITAEAVREQIDRIVGPGSEDPKRGHIPFTPRAKKILDLALREAMQLGHNYIGTEHILLGLIREGEGVAAQVLVKLGADLNRVRQKVLQLLSGDEPSGGAADRRSAAAEDVFAAARALAGDAPVGSHHLLEALSRTEGSMAARVFERLGVDPEALAAAIDELDPEQTTDATPEEAAARRMELRVDRDELHVVLRDEATVDLARELTTDGPLTAAGALAAPFVSLWAEVNRTLRQVHQAIGEPEADKELDKASLLVRRVWRDRLRRRGRRAPGE